MALLTSRDLDRIALRSSLLQATWNYERQQGLGWAFALAPAVERLDGDPAARCALLAEHTAYFNTQPTLASVALGAVAALEEQRRADPAVDAGVVARVKAVLGSALAAVGDRLFWFTLRPFAACLGLILALPGSRRGALVLWVSYNVVHLGIRWRGVFWGYRQGPAVLGDGLKDSLERLVSRLGLLGSAATGILMSMLLVPGGVTRAVPFQVLLIAGLLAGLVTAVRPRPTASQWALGVAALTLISAWIR